MYMLISGKAFKLKVQSNSNNNRAASEKNKTNEKKIVFVMILDIEPISFLSEMCIDWQS